ncbi:hypothetical protein ABID44_002532 [Aquamicrobium ahrensii]|uniref:Uncharacterized protein n=1 Tax=Aquamicrobium ahrensii TaxID=469551 RepID=A0ABV2KPY1_9HYPH
MEEDACISLRGPGFRDIALGRNAATTDMFQIEKAFRPGSLTQNSPLYI